MPQTVYVLFYIPRSEQQELGIIGINSTLETAMNRADKMEKIKKYGGIDEWRDAGKIWFGLLPSKRPIIMISEYPVEP